ncbi:unnamed protein product [Staurois parvus]|uniref:N-acetyltransferase domain-containing protein n=1 Tax=Staurois parvus TaxID=386267 RepID=A0ABN9F5K4_9NEOB|nr:unnamed protein product [Staurois parvus]
MSARVIRDPVKSIQAGRGEPSTNLPLLGGRIRMGSANNAAGGRMDPRDTNIPRQKQHSLFTGSREAQSATVIGRLGGRRAPVSAKPYASISFASLQSRLCTPLYFMSRLISCWHPYLPISVYLFFFLSTGLRRDGFEEPSPLFRCLVVEEEDEQKRAEGLRLVGYTLSHYIYTAFWGRSLYLENIYVMPQYRGKGIGSKLMMATAELCRSLGCACLLLFVHNWNQPAISFYQSCVGRDMSEEEGWHTIRFLPNDLQEMLSKNSKRAADPGLL